MPEDRALRRSLEEEAAEDTEKLTHDYVHRLNGVRCGGGVCRDHFPVGLPNLPRPLLWIEQRLTFEGDPQEYSLVSFPFYRPRPAGLGFDRRVMLGTPRREPISAEDVARLVT